MEHGGAGVHALSPLTTLLRDSEAILFDFDGPVCALFAGHPSIRVADELRGLLTSHGTNVPEPVASTADPLEILRWTGVNRPDLLAQVEQSQISNEVAAAESATPAPGGREAIEAASQSGRSVSIVSNNSAAAIKVYLDRHGLADHVAAVVGRAPGYPERMKPESDPLVRASSELGISLAACVLIGDSPTDIEAAHKAGVASIGYAKRPSRFSELADAGADVVVGSMIEVADTLRPTSGF